MAMALRHAREGKPDSSSTCLVQALQHALKNHDKRQWARCVHEVGKAYRNTDTDQAVRHYTHYAGEAEAHFGKTDTITAELYARIGDIYRSPAVGKYFESLHYFEKALQIFQQHGKENEFVAFVYHFAGTTYTRTGSYEMAKSHLHQAVRIRLALHDSLRAAQSCNNLGLVYQDLSEFSRALEWYDKGFELVASRNDEKAQMEKAALLLNKAECLFRCHRDPEAKEPLQQALAVFEKYDDPRGKSATFKALAGQHLRQGAAEKAFSYYAKALAMARMAYGEHHREVARIFIDMGDWHMAMKDTDKALGEYHRALYSLMPSVKYTGGYPAPGENDLYPEPLIMIALKQRAAAFRKTYDHRCEPPYLVRAMDDLELAAAVMDLLRDSYTYERDKELLFSAEREVLAMAAGTAIELAGLQEGSRYSGTAFHFMEKGKAYSLLELLKGVEAKKRAGLPDSLVFREQRLKAEIAALRRHGIEWQHSHGEFSAGLEQQLRAATSRFERFTHRLAYDYPEYCRIKYSDETATVARVRHMLMDDNALLLEYTLMDSTIYVFAISGNTHKVFSLPADTAFFAAVDTLRQAAGTTNFVTQPEKAYYAFTRNASRLYQLLVAPALGYLAPAGTPVRELVIVPDGILNYLPFEVLLKSPPGKTGTSYRDLHYLVKDHVVRYAYSSSTLIYQERKTRDAQIGDMIAFAPVFDPGGEVNPGTAHPPLHHSQEEVLIASGLMGGTAHLKNMATEDRFKEEAPHYDIIHLATHTFINDEEPLYSVLFFSDSKGGAEDGRLYAYELFNANLSAGLAVLSACNTGTGKLVRGEGIMSLARGFAYSGCPSVLMSLWQVSDYATATIMEGFYTALGQGKPKDVSLREAKLHYLAGADDIKSHPFYWAGFVLQGDPAPLATGWKMPWAALAWAGGGIMLLLLALRLRALRK